MIREIVIIDEEKCDGCGLCVPQCEEGAIRIVDGKAKLVADRLCDGMGACLGHCPQGAIRIEKREADAFDEEAVGEHLKRLPRTQEVNNSMGSKLKVFEPHPSGSGCPGSRYLNLAPRESKGENAKQAEKSSPETPSELRQWPVKLRLLSAEAPVLRGSRLLVAADCTAFACGSFHDKLLKGSVAVIACPKLDNTDGYVEKLAEILAKNEISEVIVSRMEVPCCSRLTQFVQAARTLAGVDTPVREAIVSVKGDIEFL